jgi:hypothetical protein
MGNRQIKLMWPPSSTDIVPNPRDDVRGYLILNIRDSFEVSLGENENFILTYYPYIKGGMRDEGIGY